MREPLRQAEAEGRGERGRVEFCARCQGAPGGDRREAVEVRGVNGLVNGHGINGHGINGHGPGHDSNSEDEDEDEDIDEDEDEEQESISSDLERELQEFVPESYRRALAGENSTTSISGLGQGSTIPAASTSNIHPTQTTTPILTTTTQTTTSTTPTPTTDANEARRQQSDRASNLIGTLLLQGYSLLSGLCDNEGCYGVPLVGHPRRQATAGSGDGESARNAGAGRAGGSGSGTGGQKKECVICGKVWEADGTVSRESRGSVGQQSGVVGQAARGARTGAGSEPAARVATGSGVGPGSGSGSGQAQPRSTLGRTISMRDGDGYAGHGRPRMRDISREEAMRIYSGEVDVSTALGTGTGSAEGERSTRGMGAGTAMDDLAAMAPAACWAAEEVVVPDSSSPAAERRSEYDTAPFISTASGRPHSRQPRGANINTSNTDPPVPGQLDIATTLNSTEQALLSTLEAINRTYLLKSSGSPAEFERFIGEGEVRKYVEASAEVMRGLQGVERMRDRMGLDSRRTRERARAREEREREREERRRWAWRNRDRDLERDLDRESYGERSISPYVNEFGGRRYYE